MKYKRPPLIFTWIFRKLWKASFTFDFLRKTFFSKKISNSNSTQITGEKIFFNSKKGYPPVIFGINKSSFKSNFFTNSLLRSKKKKKTGGEQIEKFFLNSCVFLKHFHFEEIFLPYSTERLHIGETLKNEQLPKWMTGFFGNLEKFNYIQTKTFPVSLGTDINLLICAPTGAGKTTIALHGVIRTILNSIRYKDSDIKVSKNLVKVLYLAPMRSLVKELGKNFRNLFKNKGFKVLEITGDKDILKEEIQSANFIIGTPEKIDNFSRKKNQKINFSDFKLLIIDEIHLLNEKRGAILEETVVRFLTNFKNRSSSIRIIGLSATLPNYYDVGNFLQTNLKQGVFFFGPRFRPIPLNKTIIGVKKFLDSNTKISSFNRILFFLVKKILSENFQKNVIIFVHSRRDTIKTGILLLTNLNNLKTFNGDNRSQNSNHFIQALRKIRSIELKNLIKNGIGIHHAGMAKEERNLTEEFFRKGYLNILISTATLAWGLNLPATNVIIKGTKIYSPEKSSWVEITDFNVIQMIGRAGRSLENLGSEGVLITTRNNLGHYLDLFNDQSPIESRLLKSLPDSLNTECSGKRIFNIYSVLNWFSKTFFWIRLKRIIRNNIPDLRGVKKRNLLIYIENNFICESINELIGAGMILLDKKKGQIKSTPFGKICSASNISYQTLAQMLSQISYNSTFFEVIRIISISNEFSSFQIRKGEKDELLRLEKLIFFPSKETSLSQTLKVNILLQCYIEKLKINNLSLEADSIFIGRTALRLSKALFEISVFKKLGSLSQICLTIYKAIRERDWVGKKSHPFFYFDTLTEIEKINTKKYELDANSFRASKKENFVLPGLKNTAIKKQVNFTPLFRLSFFLQPITRNTLRVHFIFKFELDFRSFGKTKEGGLWFFIEDQIHDTIVFFNYLRIKRHKMGKFLSFSTQIPIYDNPPSPYFRLRIIPDKPKGSNFEFSINLTQIYFPMNFSLETDFFKTLSSSPIRIFSGFKGGSVLAEYFLTHFCKLNPFFFQNSPYTLKRLGKKILIENTKNLRNLFLEFAILSYFLSSRIFIGFFLSCGLESSNLKTIQIRKSSISVFGLLVLKLKGENKNRKFELLSKKFLFILSPMEFSFFEKKFLKKSKKKIVFFGDLIHLLGDWNYGNSIEEVLGQIIHFSDITETPLFSWSMFSVKNSFDLLNWLRMGQSQVFCRENEERFSFSPENWFFRSEKTILISKKKKNFHFFCSDNRHLKEKITNFFFFRLSFSKPEFLNLLSKSKKNVYHPIKKKIPLLFSFLGISLIDNNLEFDQQRLIQELGVARKLKIVFWTLDSLANIGSETLTNKNCLILLQSRMPKGGKHFFPNFFFLNKKKKNGKESVNIPNISSFNDVVLESLWDIWFIENTLNFLNKKNSRKKREILNYFLKTFFFVRFFQNPNFYCGNKKVAENFSVKNFFYSVILTLKTRGYIFVNSRFNYEVEKKIKKFFQFALFQQRFFSSYFSWKKNPDALEILKEISKKHLCDLIRRNSILVWFLDKRLKKKNLNFPKKSGLSFFKKKKTQVELAKFEVLIMISVLLSYWQEKGNLKSILLLLDFDQLLRSGVIKKGKNIGFLSLKENLIFFLFGKIHNVHSNEKIIQLFFSSFKSNILKIPRFYKEIFIKNSILEIGFLVNFSMEKNETKKRLKIEAGCLLSTFPRNLLKFSVQHKKFSYRNPNCWWIIIGDFVSNRVFFCKKIKGLMEFRVELDFLSGEEPPEFNFFAINQVWSHLDKEAIFSPL